MQKPHATEALAEFVSALAFESIPPSLNKRLKECLLDFIANASYAASYAESSDAFRAAVTTFTDTEGDSTVVGDDKGRTLYTAALLNGAFAHTLDFDDTNVWGSLHPGAPVIAAALVEAERLRSTGADWLAALAVGYEVACRVGAALGVTAYDRGFHITGIAGIFGAVASIARLRSLDAKAVASAFGIAGSKAAASMQYLENGSWNKRLHPGFAAHDALLSVAFAQAGVMGATASLEGRYGILAGYTNDPRPELLTDRLNDWWASGSTAIKPYPSCRFTHAAIEATLELRERMKFLNRNEINWTPCSRVKFQIRLSPQGMQIVGEPRPNKVNARNVVDAQFSVYFQVAAAWLDGRINWQSYERIGAADIETLTSFIEVTPDPTVPIAGAVVSLISPNDHSVRIDEPLGENSRPMEGAALHSKFNDLMIPVFGDNRTKEISNHIEQLESECDAAAIIKLLRRDRI